MEVQWKSNGPAVSAAQCTCRSSRSSRTSCSSRSSRSSVDIMAFVWSSVEISAHREAKLVEFSSIMTSEPGQIYAQFTRLKHSVAKNTVQQFIKIVERPIAEEDLWEKTQQKLTEQGVRAKFDQAALYDPLSPAAEITNLRQIVKMASLVNERRRGEFMQFMVFGIVGVLIGIIGEYFGFQGVDFMKFYALAGAAWKIMSLCVWLTTVVEFGMAELGRMRFSVISGNVAQLLMRMEEKLNYMERRSNFPRDSYRVPSESQRTVGEILRNPDRDSLGFPRRFAGIPREPPRSPWRIRPEVDAVLREQGRLLPHDCGAGRRGYLAKS